MDSIFHGEYDNDMIFDMRDPGLWFVCYSFTKKRGMYEHGDRIHLVGGLNPSEKYEFVSWGYYSQYVEK